MNKSKKVLATLAVACVAFAAVGASSAMAEVVNGKWSAGTIKLALSGTLTVKRNGGEAKTCEMPAGPATGQAVTGSGAAFAWNDSVTGETKFSCGSAQLALYFSEMLAHYDTTTGKYSVQLLKVGPQASSPWGNYNVGFYGKPSGEFTNGSGTTASTLSFNEALVGGLVSDSSKITVTGTFNVTTTSGGLLTLSH